MGVFAAGLDFAELEQELREAGVTVSTSRDIARRVAELLERFEGAETAQRYWLVRRLHRLPRPLPCAPSWCEGGRARLRDPRVGHRGCLPPRRPAS